MTIRAEDLPPDVRNRLGLAAGRAKPSRAGTGLSVPCPGHCGCGHPFPTAAAWERHAVRTGCAHWRIDLPEPQETP